MAFAYGWGYKDIFVVPLEELDWLMKEAIEIYERKYKVDKAILSLVGVKDN